MPAENALQGFLRGTKTACWGCLSLSNLRSASRLLMEGNAVDAQEELNGVIDKLNDIYELLLLETRGDFP